ncbi:MAG: CNNM domain-containing protein [Desulfobulbaceae bacterium]|jgi:metal transporter CNNM|nr:CNNM domain-containing protein [Desulfobulbaceae bacterium]
MHDLTIWLGILFCISQSAMFSGLNLAFFSISKMRLKVEVANGNKAAAKILKMRNDGNFFLTTILWGNVGINVLLTLLSNSMLAGLMAFLFSTVFITLIGEILPQAYFSRNAMRMASALAPALKFYQILLYPVAKPAAMVLDAWLGGEVVHYFKESDMEEVLNLHIRAEESDISAMEGRGALNFLALDDLTMLEEGERVDPQSIISLPFDGSRPLFPPFQHQVDDPFIRLIQASGRAWVIITDEQGEAIFALDADAFLRDALFEADNFRPLRYCHRPIVVSDPKTPLEEVISRFKVQPQRKGDDVIDADIILLWGVQKRVITGADILGRLLRGIVRT